MALFFKLNSFGPILKEQDPLILHEYIFVFHIEYIKLLM